MLIDSHAHLEDKKFSRDLDRVLARARDCGIERLVCIADDLLTSRRALALARRRACIWATAGVHPHNETRFTDETIDELKKLAAHRRVVAIGEAGLDFHYPGDNHERQRDVLLRQAHLASSLGLPMVLHCRDAYPELIELFRKEKKATCRGVVHCFSGTYEDAKALLDLGFYLGIGGTVTYPGGGALRQTLEKIGLEGVVAETDAPYLAPQKRRGRRNEPSYMKFTIKALADISGFTYQDVARLTSANATRLYGLPPPESEEWVDSARDRLYLNVNNRGTNDGCYRERISDYVLHGHYLELPGEPSAREILDAIEEPERYAEFVICGLGEPTLRFEVVLELARELKKQGRRVRLNTNGHGNLIAGSDITPRLLGLFDAVAVTMNAHDRKTYNKISSPADAEASFEAMLDFTRKVKRHVPDVRMRVVALPEVDVEECRRIAEEEIKVRFQVRPPRPDGSPVRAPS